MTETPLADNTGTTQGCPIPHGGDSAAECPVPRVGSQDGATRVFSQSVLISGVRCVLAYVIFPWVLPLLGVAKGVGPWIGVTVGVVAIGFNVASIRRFWAADHRWKWPITIMNCSVIGLLLFLLVTDLAAL